MATIEPIAHIHTDFKEKFGIPRQSCLADGCIGRIVFVPKYRDHESLRCIDGFSHIWLLFDFSESHTGDWSPTVRPPRLGGNRKVGVFASRSPFRPNSIGLSSVRLVSLEHTDEGDTLVVEGADLLDGTPIYDIKPYLRFTDSHPDAVSGYADDVCAYRLKVDYDASMMGCFDDTRMKELISCLEQDPRPQYQDDGREYKMDFCGHDVSFVVSGDVLRITDVR